MSALHVGANVVPIATDDGARRVLAERLCRTGRRGSSLVGPSDEVLRRPWTGVAVRGPRSLQEFIDLDPRLNQHIQHMMDLPYERVLKAAKRLLAERAA